MWSRVVMQEANMSPIAEFFSNPVELLAVELSGHSAIIREELPVDYTLRTPPHPQHDFHRMRSRSYGYDSPLTKAKPLTPGSLIGVQNPLLIACHKVPQQLIPINGEQLFAQVDSFLQLCWRQSMRNKISIFPCFPQFVKIFQHSNMRALESCGKLPRGRLWVFLNE